jgi:preprotein translocase subunit SecE
MKAKEIVKDKVIKEKEGNLISKGIKFLEEVKIEAKKITWPPKKQVILSVLMIMFFSIIIGAYLGLLDIIYNALISFLVR